MNHLLSFARRFALPEWRWYLGGIFFLALTNILTLLIPQLAKQVVDGFDQLGGAHHLSEIALAIIGLGVLLLIIRALSRVLIFWPGRKLEGNARYAQFNHALSLPNRFFERYGLGDLISRLTNDIGHLRVFFAFGALQALNLIFLLSFTITMMFSIHATLTIAALTPLTLMIVLMRYANPRMYQFSRANQEAIGQLTNQLTASLINIHVIQANAAEQAFLKRIGHENDLVYRTNMRVLVMRQVVWPMITLLAGLAQAIVLLYGGFEVIQGNVSKGDIMAFNVYIGYLSFPLSALGIILSLYQRAVTSIERLHTIESEHVEQGSITALDRDHEPCLEVRNLTYSFESTPSSAPVLKNISLAISKGEHIGILGTIGSGKTTLLNLIVRLQEPPPGTIFLGGTDVTEVSPNTLREEVGYVMQTPLLFSDSVEDNLALGFEAPPDRLRAAASAAQILEDIERFPQQWQTQIGERGLRLSGGQKQRLALARAFLRQHQILLLDDVLAAVDHATEEALVSYLRSSRQTTIVASHRLSVLRTCDRVILLQGGEVLDCAPLNTLQARYPEYFREVTDG